MKYVVILLTVSLGGCFSHEVPPKYFEWATKACADNGGLSYLEAYEVFTPNAMCNNGAYFKGYGKDFRPKDD